MTQLVLRIEDVQKVLNVCRTDGYKIIKEIKTDYIFSGKLIGSKVRTQDLAHAYDLKMEDIFRILNEQQ